MPEWLGKHPRVLADQTKTYASSFSTERILGYSDTLLTARSASQNLPDGTDSNLQSSSRSQRAEQINISRQQPENAQRPYLALVSKPYQR
jgi:hypothetical protein